MPIFDIAFFQKMFAEGGFVSELKEIQKVSIQKEAEQQVQGLNRGQQRNKTLQKQVRDIVEAATSKNEEEYKSAEALINMLASIIPYPQILCISNYLTRAKEKLKIYWSSETMQEVVAGFSVDTSRQKSLAIIKEKLKQDKNT